MYEYYTSKVQDYNENLMANQELKPEDAMDFLAEYMLKIKDEIFMRYHYDHFEQMAAFERQIQLQDGYWTN